MTALVTSNMPPASPMDGFDCHDSTSSSIGADYVKFDGAAQNVWHGRDGAGLFLGPYLAVNCQVELLRWKDKKVVDRIVQKPGEDLPDVDELGEAIREDWEEDFSGNPKNPSVKNYTNFLVDPKTGAKVVVSNSTIGQRIAFENLKERTQFMRRLRGENVYPLVKLSSKSMRTCFGLKQRPDFEIVDWQTLGAPAPKAVAAPADPAPTPWVPKAIDPTIGKVITKPTPAEIVDDQIPF